MLCLVVVVASRIPSVVVWLIYPYTSGRLGNIRIVLVQVNQPLKLSVQLTSTKQNPQRKKKKKNTGQSVKIHWDVGCTVHIYKVKLLEFTLIRALVYMCITLYIKSPETNETTDALLVNMDMFSFIFKNDISHVH